MSKVFEREYWSDSSDPHKVGPIRVLLSDDGLVVSWVGDARPILALKPSELMDLARVTAAESDLTWMREEAQNAVTTIQEMRDEMRGMLTVMRGNTNPPTNAVSGSP